MKTTIFLALLIGLGFGLAINSAATKSASAEVYSTCTDARISGNFTNCRDLQSKYNIEFLCNSASCWTEAK